MLKAGTKAPRFTLLDQDENEVSLADQQGHWVIFWWYPKASTGGCTKQGCSLRDNAPDFSAADCVILGASFDTPADNKFFVEDQHFPFRLLCDTDKKVGTLYEVARDPSDEKADRPIRIAYLIDPEGTIRKSYEVSDTAGFATAVLADLKELQ